MKKTWYQRIKPEVKKRSPAGIKTIIENFKEKGSSFHSSRGETLAFLVVYCEENKISYRITAHPDLGYQIEILPPALGLTQPPVEEVELAIELGKLITEFEHRVMGTTRMAKRLLSKYDIKRK